MDFSTKFFYLLFHDCVFGSPIFFHNFSLYEFFILLFLMSSYLGQLSFLLLESDIPFSHLPSLSSLLPSLSPLLPYSSLLFTTLQESECTGHREWWDLRASLQKHLRTFLEVSITCTHVPLHLRPLFRLFFMNILFHFQFHPFNISLLLHLLCIHLLFLFLCELSLLQSCWLPWISYTHLFIQFFIPYSSIFKSYTLTYLLVRFTSYV